MLQIKTTTDKFNVHNTTLKDNTFSGNEFEFYRLKALIFDFKKNNVQRGHRLVEETGQRRQSQTAIENFIRFFIGM